MTERENAYTREDLKIMQSWDLERKIRVTQTRIMEWYQHYDGKVYVSFSGGKDSTVLLDLARRIYPDIPAVFVDTGLEYPSIRSFVKTKENVIWLKPEMSFKDVIETYGYPAISKNVSHNIAIARKNPEGKVAKNIVFADRTGKYNIKKWSFMVDAPFVVSDKCCGIMKKTPIHKFNKANNMYPIIGTMACESLMRQDTWIKNGCNAFNAQSPHSQPMSFWTEQDVLQYIKRFNIPYADIYGDIVEENGKLKTTGEHRTGCMFCMFGAHLEKEPNRFQRMKEQYPKQYDFCIRPIEENGLGLGKVLDYIGVNYK